MTTVIPFFISSDPIIGNIFSKSLDGSTFQISFNPAIQIPHTARRSDLKLYRANIWYIFVNVSAEFGNDKFVFTEKKVSPIPDVVHTITLLSGLYGLGELESFIDIEVQKKGFPVGTFLFIGENSTQKVILQIRQINLQVNWVAGTFFKLVGFQLNQNIPATGFTTGVFSERASDIAQFSDLTTILIHSSLSTGTIFNGNSSDVLGTVPITAAPGSLITYYPTNIIKIPSNNLIGIQITSATFYITDQKNKLLNTNKENWNFEMTIEYE